MAYYLAPSLVQLRAEIKARWDDRDDTSDGWIGDTSHAARKSDHNPDWDSGGVVRAVDIDDDFASVSQKRLVVATLIADPRVAYIITDGRIWKRRTGQWETYYGPNAHFSHIHVSILHTKHAETSTRAWLPPAIRPATEDDDDMKLTEKIGRSGITVGVALERAAAQVSQISRLRGQVSALAADVAEIKALLKDKR